MDFLTQDSDEVQKLNRLLSGATRASVYLRNDYSGYHLKFKSNNTKTMRIVRDNVVEIYFGYGETLEFLFDDYVINNNHIKFFQTEIGNVLTIVL